MIKCALLGYGYWGKILLKYLRNNIYLEVKYIYKDKNDKEFLKKMLLDDELDCVFICTPIETHYSLCKFFLGSGKHVFCEKPLTGDYYDDINLYKIANDNNVILFVDYIYLYSKSINYIKGNIKKLGNIKYIKGEIKQFGKFYKEDVIDVLGVHIISALNFILDYDFRNMENFNRFILYKTNERIDDIKMNFILKDIYFEFDFSQVFDIKKRKIEIFCENANVVFDMMTENTVCITFFYDDEEGFKIDKKIYEIFDESNNLNYSVQAFLEEIFYKKHDNKKYSLLLSKSLNNLKQEIYKST